MLSLLLCVVCTLPRLEGWHIALTVIGASALVVAIVITIVGIVLAYKRKWTGELYCTSPKFSNNSQSLYF